MQSRTFQYPPEAMMIIAVLQLLLLNSTNSGLHDLVNSRNQLRRPSQSLANDIISVVTFVLKIPLWIQSST